MKKDTWRSAVSGAAAGAANGLFGGGGGSVLVPLLTRFCGLEQRQAFSTSLAVILPLCILSAAVYLFRGGLDLLAALPYLIGGTVGGWLGGDGSGGCGWCGSGVPSGFCCCMGERGACCELSGCSRCWRAGPPGCCPASEWGAGRCFWCI